MVRTIANSERLIYCVFGTDCGGGLDPRRRLLRWMRHVRKAGARDADRAPNTSAADVVCQPREIFDGQRCTSLTKIELIAEADRNGFAKSPAQLLAPSRVRNIEFASCIGRSREKIEI